MTRRREADHYGNTARKMVPSDDLGPLFTQSAEKVEQARQETALGRERAASALASRGVTGQQLVTLARSCARAAGEITVADLRDAAVKEGVLTGRETGRELSYLGHVMTAAGLVNTGRYVRSHIEGAHGNLNVLWAWPDGAR